MVTTVIAGSKFSLAHRPACGGLDAVTCTHPSSNSNQINPTQLNATQFNDHPFLYTQQQKKEWKQWKQTALVKKKKEKEEKGWVVEDSKEIKIRRQNESGKRKIKTKGPIVSTRREDSKEVNNKKQKGVRYQELIATTPFISPNIHW
jgi:hypothetical protein